MNLNGFVNKNFVVRNGLEVSENLIYADDQQRRIGVGIITARYDLDVIGGIGATTVTSEGSVVTGLSTSNNNKIDGYISVGGTTGTNGQYLISTGQGLQWFRSSSSKRGVHIRRSRRTNNFLVWSIIYSWFS